MCLFSSSCFHMSTLCQSGSVTFLGVVLPFPHTHSQQPQCCSRLVHVISNPLQLEWASVGLKQTQQTAAAPKLAPPVRAPQNSPSPQPRRLQSRELEGERVNPVATQTLHCDSPWQRAYSCDSRKIEPLWFFFPVLIWHTHTDSIVRTNISDSTGRLYNSTCLAQCRFSRRHGYTTPAYHKDQHSRRAGSISDRGWLGPPQLI